ncbi:MAG TPA: TIGR01459 family HAD-type hydrolase [Rhizobiales bacterium]|nr:putative hydrolase YutF [bacterium BMS3Bbin10]HDO51622.1 TIGR01459 family HAD-type hydrolase [Hyphomicrobiales bacterium]
MTTAQHDIPVLSSIADLAGGYAVWLCDIWGVMHNGVNLFPGAVNACRRFREERGLVVLLSNSPRPNEPVARQLAEVGVPETAYDVIVTSGDATRNLMSEKPGLPVFHLGPERDKPLFEGLDVELAGLDEAEYVLLSGLYDDLTETPDDYRDLLAQIKSRDLPVICANPDLQVERGNQLIYCAGALAAAYEKLGGEVVYTGKPHKPIYDLALARIAEVRGARVRRSEILCIGDGLRTDMAGAFAARMDALFVASALHIDGANSDAPLEGSTVRALFSETGIKPIAAQKGLNW